jgi:serine/threonine protein kinase
MDLKELIGEGSNSKVYKLNHDNVIKVFNNDDAYDKDIIIYSMFKETNKYFLDLIGTVDTDKNKGIIFPYVPYNLEEFIKGNYNKKIRDIDVCKLIVNILCGINELHSKKIYHRDFKAKNLLMDDELNIKIIDFDLSKINLSDEDFEKGKYDDLKLARIIIYQIIWQQAYHDCCYQKRKCWENVKTEFITLGKLLTVRNYNLSEIILYFADSNNIRDIWEKTMK